ncbi:MAG: anaerobic ribonucleoside-triphosphate reductase [Oscillospiraceae bacterium]
MTYTVDGGTMDEREVNEYVRVIQEKYPDKVIKEINFKIDGDYVDMNYTFDEVPFERIRRITGYLVGTLDRFNNAKRQEVEDRVKHSI